MGLILVSLYIELQKGAWTSGSVARVIGIYLDISKELDQKFCKIHALHHLFKHNLVSTKYHLIQILWKKNDFLQSKHQDLSWIRTGS